MNLQLVFLLIFLAGGLSVWMLMKMSKQVEHERRRIIRKKVGTVGGIVISIELIKRKHCSFSSEYKNPDLVYKFYKVSYDIEYKPKACWAVLEMKQRSYGPSSAIQTNWIWRGFP